MVRNTKVILVSRPKEFIQSENFRVVEEEIDVDITSGLVVKIMFISVDPAMRGRLFAVGVCGLFITIIQFISKL